MVGVNNNTITQSLQNAEIVTSNNDYATIVGSDDKHIGLEYTYFVTGKVSNFDGAKLGGINEKPIGNSGDTQDYDVTPDELQSVDSYEGFNFDNIYNSSINTTGPQFKYSPKLNTTTNILGSGTEADPYLIGTMLEFNTFVKNINSGVGNTIDTYYALTGNIDASGFMVEPINEFNANFNGSGFTITGLQIATSAQSNVAFVKINNGVIKNFTLSNAIIIGDNNVAAVAVTNEGLIHGVVVEGVVIGRNVVAGVVAENNNNLVRLGNHAYVSGINNVAGVVAKLNNSNVDGYSDIFDYSFNEGSLVVPYTGITESYNRGNIFGNTNVAGLVASANNTSYHITIKNAYNTGRVSGVNYVAGIVAQATNAGIQFVYSFGDIISMSDTATTVAEANIGHIVGNGQNVVIGYVTDSVKGAALYANDTKFIHIKKAEVTFTGTGFGNNSATNTVRTVSLGYTTLQNQLTYTAYDFDFANIWKFYDKENNFNYKLPILKFFHAHLITITTNGFGVYEAEEYNPADNIRVTITPNARGEIYILNNNNLYLKFTSDPHYHVYKQIVDGVEKTLQKADDENGVPDNKSTKIYEYEFEKVTEAHRMYIEFILDRYKFTLSTNPATHKNGATVGLVEGNNIYSYGDEVTLTLSGIDHFKFINLENISKSTAEIALDPNSLNVDGDNYSLFSVDDFYTEDFEQRKLLLTETRSYIKFDNGDGSFIELNYSTNQIVIKFMASDFAAGGSTLDEEGAYAYGNYVANIIEQFDVTTQIKTYYDISKLIIDEGNIGGTLYGEVNGKQILDNNGYGLIDDGDQITFVSAPGVGYAHIDYTNIERNAEGTHTILANTVRYTTEPIEGNANFVTNFERMGYEIKLILGENGTVTLYNYDYNRGEYIEGITYSEAGTYVTTVRHGYILKIDVKSKPGFAIESVTPINMPEDTSVTIPDNIYVKNLEFANVTGPFDVDMKFRRELWTDHPSDSLSGSGTKDDPYLITNGHDWGYIANQVNLNGVTFNDVYFLVKPENGNVIDLDQYYFNPIGISNDSAKQFKGIIMGDFNIIHNTKIESASTKVGFFIEQYGIIENLTFKDVMVTSSAKGAYVGAIASHNYGSLTNIQVTGTVDGAGYVGGLVGINKIGGVITKVKNMASVSSTDAAAAGIAAENQGEIYDALNVAIITNEVGSAGGIVANNINYGKLERVNNTGSVNGKTYAGGIVASYDSGDIIDAYNTGKVTGLTAAGGIVGTKVSTNETAFNLTNVYNTGSVSASTTGGIYGVASGATNNFNNVYFINIYGGNSEQINAVSKSYAELKSIDTFNDYNFNTVWGINENFNDGNPYLRSANTWDSWDDFALEIIPDESGVYHITNAEELAWISVQSNLDPNFSDSKTFVLDTNINLYGHYFTPISTNADIDFAFNGNFDANGYSIYGLTIETNYQSNFVNYVGLFGYVDGSRIINLKLEDSYIDVTDKPIEQIYVGALAGVANNATIRLVDVNKTVNTRLGEIVIKSNSSQTTSASVGGFVGNATQTTIEHVTNYLNVSANEQNVTLGGFIGSVSGNVTIDQISNSNNITITQAQCVGGIIGSMVNNNNSLTNAFFNGNIVASSTSVLGGIVGQIGSGVNVVKYTYANPTNFNVSATTVGGVIGVLPTYTTSAVTNADNVAYNYYNSSMGLNVKQGVGKAGSTNYGSFATTFYVDRAEQKSSVELKTESTYKTWNFDTIWAIDYEGSNLNNGFPLFFYNNTYQVVNVTVTHELYEVDGVEYGEVVRRNFNNDGTQSERVVKTHDVTEQVYVLNGNYIGFDVIPYEEGVIDTVMVDGVVQVGRNQEYVQFAKTTTPHTIEVYFIRKLYELTIKGVITADDGLEVDSNALITAMLRNTRTGTAYLITLTNGQSRTLYDIARGDYVLIVNPPMYYDVYTRYDEESTEEDNVLGVSTTFSLIPTATDAYITVTINKSHDRWLNDSNHNF